MRHTYREPEFEELPPEILAETLRQFYAEVRTRDGAHYSRSSLVNICAALQRHITAPPFNRTFNKLRDAVFGPVNQAIQGQIKQLRATGKDAFKHKEAIEGDDLVKLYAHCDVRTAPGLQNKVFIDLLLHFARRGREGL